MITESSKFKAKISVLLRCAEDKFYDGYSHSSKVILAIPLFEYHILAKILCKNISFIYKLGISDILKEELLKDMRTIKTILEKSEKGCENEGLG